LATYDCGSDQYHLSRAGQQYGPYTWEALYQLGINGNLYPGDQIWSESLGTWTSIETIPELKQYITTVQTGRPKWLIPATLTLFGLAVILVAAVLFRQTTRLTVKEYYPRSGPAGSCVLLEISKSVEPEHVKILCGDHNLAFSYLGDNCYSVILPTDPSSNQIRLLYKDKEADSVSFAVLQPEITLLHEEKLRPSPTGQRIESKAGISVTLPGEFLDKQRYLTISRVTNPAVPRQDPFHDLEYIDITIDGLSQLKDYIEIGIPYDPSLIDPSIPLEANFDPAYWNEEEQKWIDVYYRVDPDSHKVYFITNHLSVTITGLAAWAAVVGVASEIGERLLNDKYISRDRKVRILYSDADLQQRFPNKNWEARIAQGRLHAGNWYDPNISSAVQDIGHIFDISLDCYMREGFADPTVKTVWGKHVYNRYVKVKVDSWYNAGGEMSHDTFWDQINVPSYLINTYFYDENMTARDTFEDRFTRLKAFLSHELFHVFQRPYYSITIALIQTPHLWWREACAEWASHDLAKIPDRPGWYKDSPHITPRIGPKYLDFPADTSGEIPGTFRGDALEYQYLNSVFIRYLVRQRNISIRDVTERIAAEGSANPLEPLRVYLRGRTGLGFDELFADYAPWLLQESQVPLSDFSHPDNQSIAAERSDTVIIKGTEATLRFYQNCGDSGNQFRLTAFKVSGGREHLTPQDTPLFRLEECYPDDYEEIEVEKGDHLYFIAPNGETKPARAGLTVQTMSDDEWENAAYITMEAKPNGTAKVWAIQICSEAILIDPPEIENATTHKDYEFDIKAVGLPDFIKEAAFTYDFGDKQKDSTGKVTVPVSGGEAQFSLTHAYKPIPNLNGSTEPIVYTLTVEMYHEKEKRLEAEADVSIDPVELVVTPRHSVGPPGATFDMEAKARPEDNYRFVWEMEGKAEAFEDQGRESGIAPVLEREGKFAVTVNLYDLNGTLLAKDRVTAEVTKEETSKPKGGGYWKLDRVETEAKNIRQMYPDDPIPLGNAKAHCGENFTTSVSIHREEVSISYSGNKKESMGGGEESVEYLSTWTDPGDIIRPGILELRFSSRELARNYKGGDIIMEAGFNDGPQGYFLKRVINSANFMELDKSYRCHTTVKLGEDPATDTCTMTPEITEGQEGGEIYFSINAISWHGHASLTMIYIWTPEPN